MQNNILLQGSKVGYRDFWFLISEGVRLSGINWVQVPIATFQGTELPPKEVQVDVQGWFTECNPEVVTVWIGPNIKPDIDNKP